MNDNRKKGCFIALGIVGALVVILGVFLVWGVFKTVDYVQDFAEVYQPSPQIIAESKALNRDYPFTKSDDGAFTAEQIESFISVKETFAERIKKYKEEFEGIEEAIEGGLEDFDKFKEIGVKLIDIRHDLIYALKQHKMSLKEYAFLSEQIYKSFFGSIAIDIPYLNEDEREEIRNELNPHNVELLNKYRDQLLQVETWGLEFLFSAPLFD